VQPFPSTCSFVGVMGLFFPKLFSSVCPISAVCAFGLPFFSPISLSLFGCPHDWFEHGGMLWLLLYIPIWSISSLVSLFFFCPLSLSTHNEVQRLLFVRYATQEATALCGYCRNHVIGFCFWCFVFCCFFLFCFLFSGHQISLLYRRLDSLRCSFLRCVASCEALR
jgi:hypothetical protein